MTDEIASLKAALAAARQEAAEARECAQEHIETQDRIRAQRNEAQAALAAERVANAGLRALALRLSFGGIGGICRTCGGLRAEGHLDVCPHAALSAAPPLRPLDVMLHCPSCGLQHIDKPEPGTDWTNPPHKSHKCHGCGVIWRASDEPTNGIAAPKTRGSADTWDVFDPASPLRAPDDECPFCHRTPSTRFDCTMCAPASVPPAAAPQEQQGARTSAWVTPGGKVVELGEWTCPDCGGPHIPALGGIRVGHPCPRTAPASAASEPKAPPSAAAPAPIVRGEE